MMAGFLLRVSGCGLRVAGFRLRVSGCGFQVAGYGLLPRADRPEYGFWLRVVSYGLRACLPEWNDGRLLHGADRPEYGFWLRVAGLPA